MFCIWFKDLCTANRQYICKYVPYITRSSVTADIMHIQCIFYVLNMYFEPTKHVWCEYSTVCFFVRPKAMFGSLGPHPTTQIFPWMSVISMTQLEWIGVGGLYFPLCSCITDWPTSLSHNKHKWVTELILFLSYYKEWGISLVTCLLSKHKACVGCAALKWCMSACLS